MPAKKAATATTRAKRKSAASTKTASSKKRTSKAKAKPTKAGDREVTIDRRKADRSESAGTAADRKPIIERREKVQRRRQIDPTTCERDYSNEEVEFMNAMDEYKRKSGRMFPTCSEVLEVIRELGYAKLTTAELAILRPQENNSDDPVVNADEFSAEADAELETIGADHAEV